MNQHMELSTFRITTRIPNLSNQNFWLRRPKFDKGQENAPIILDKLTLTRLL